MNGNEAAFLKYIQNRVEEGECNDFNYLEIGVAEGHTMAGVCEFLKGLDKKRWRVIGVDIPNGWSFNIDSIHRNLDKYGLHFVENYDTNVIYHFGYGPFLATPQGGSREFMHLLPIGFDFVFIDGCHGYNCVRRDFLNVSKRMRKGGVVAFHDANESCQGIHIQPCCQEGINVRKALKDLGLLDGKCEGWEFLEETNAEMACVFVKKL